MFIPHTSTDQQTMLAKLGLTGTAELFVDIPEAQRNPKINLPKGLSEMEVSAVLRDLAGRNASTDALHCFLGAGAYKHFIPAAVDAIIQRGEFLTSYTPYQPEVSQGTLQAIFEFQSLICALTGLDVANASHYDGATACAEAAILAYHHHRTKRRKFIISPTVNPQYVETLKTYLPAHSGFEVIRPELDVYTKPDDLAGLIDDSTALVLVQYPDFLGRLYDYTNLVASAHDHGALVSVSTYPHALGLLKPPSVTGADIITGDGQSLGIPLSFGGPYLGFFAVRKELSRRISGRLVGETVDGKGNRGYVLTLTAREQHIRRERATSNICTNQGLMALAATTYMSMLGKQGFREAANLSYQHAHYAADRIDEQFGFTVDRSQPFFNEFVIQTPGNVDQMNRGLLERGYLGGFNLARFHPGWDHHMLVAFTELNDRDTIDGFVTALAEVSHA